MVAQAAARKTSILAIADEVEASLFSAEVRNLRPDLVVACGDLPFDYLEFIVTMVNVPLLYVPGNHDPDLKKAMSKPLVKPDIDEWRVPGPEGCTNIDGRVVDAGHLRVAGLGGSARYNNGPNQYTEREMRRRALTLELRCRTRNLRDGRAVDLLVTHAPPLGLGDDDDEAHRGFNAFHRLVKKLAPRMMIHGHVHPYGQGEHDHRLEGTAIVNAVSSRMIELET
jgi:Icc-related predicted phosphoesterase